MVEWKEVFIPSLQSLSIVYYENENKEKTGKFYEESQPLYKRTALYDKIEELVEKWEIQDLRVENLDRRLCQIGIEWKLYPTKSYTGFKTKSASTGDDNVILTFHQLDFESYRMTPIPLLEIKYDGINTEEFWTWELNPEFTGY